MRFPIAALLGAVACLSACSCEHMDDASSLALPDRDKEGFSGPGFNVDDDIPKSDINRPEIGGSSIPKPQNEVGVDFFRYKKKF